MRDDATVVVRAMAFVLANGVAYGARHNITRQAVGNAFAALDSFLGRHGALVLDATDDVIMVAGQAAGESLPVVAALARRLVRMGAASLVLRPGMTAEEFTRFAEWLLLPEAQVREAGGLAGLLRDAGLVHVSSVTASYVRVTDDQAVVSRDVAKAAGGLTPAARTRLRRQLEAPEGGAATEGLAELRLDDESVIGELARLVFSPEEAAGWSRDEIVDCAVRRLRRLRDGLLALPAGRTAKGRRAVRRLIETVESEAADRLMTMGDDGSAIRRLAAAAKELVEGLAVDDLVARHLKQRGDVAASTERLARRLERVAGDEAAREKLHARLIAAGLSEASWTALCARAGVPGATTAALHALCGRLRTGGGAPLAASEAAAFAAEIGRVVEQAAERADERIAALARMASRPLPRDADAELTRRELLAMMAELGQELRQPLTVINGVLEMLRGRLAEAPAAERKPLLALAVESGRQMDRLIDRMVEIAGVPRTLQPERRILARFE